MDDVTVAAQVLGPTKYSPIRFMFDDSEKEFESRFCSLAVAEKEGGEAVFLAPESLAVSVAENVEDCLRLLENRELLKQRVREKILQDERGEVVIVPSVGVYQGKDGFTVDFEHDVTMVEAFMFLFFVKQLRQNKKIVFDVSTGLNIYPSIGIRALYNAVVYQLLLNFLPALKGKFQAERHRVAFYPPIVAGIEKVNVKFRFVSTNVRYDFPISLRRIEKAHNTLWGMGICFKDTNVTAILKNGRRAFNCIRYNTPLPLYRDDIIRLFEPEEINNVEARIIDGLETLVRIHSAERGPDNKITVKRSSHDMDFAREVLNALAVTRSFMQIVRQIRRSLCEKGVSLEEIKNCFVNDIYGKAEIFRLNANLLQFELESIKQSSKKLAPGEASSLQLLIGVGGSQDHERNFFAHSGFLKDIIVVKKDDVGNVYLDYCFGAESVNNSTVQNWLWEG